MNLSNAYLKVSNNLKINPELNFEQVLAKECVIDSKIELIANTLLNSRCDSAVVADIILQKMRENITDITAISKQLDKENFFSKKAIKEALNQNTNVDLAFKSALNYFQQGLSKLDSTQKHFSHPVSITRNEGDIRWRLEKYEKFFTKETLDCAFSLRKDAQKAKEYILSLQKHGLNHIDEKGRPLKTVTYDLGDIEWRVKYDSFFTKEAIEQAIFEIKNMKDKYNLAANVDAKLSLNDSPIREPENVNQLNKNGLYNLGATCYLNSALQSIINTPIHQNLLGQLNKREGESDISFKKRLDLQVAFSRLVELKKSSNNRSKTTEQNKKIAVDFYTAFNKAGWLSEPNVMEDASDALFSLLADLSSSEKIYLRSHIFTDEGDIVQNITEVNNIAGREFPVFNFNIDSTIRNAQQLVDKYFNSQELISDYSFKDKKVSAIETKELINFPGNFILKVTDPKSNRTFIPSVDSVNLKSIDGNKSNYSPNFFILHHGDNFNGGHYTSVVKNEIGEWLHYNDLEVRKISAENLKSEYLLPNNVYLIGYQSSLS